MTESWEDRVRRFAAARGFEPTDDYRRRCADGHLICESCGRCRCSTPPTDGYVRTDGDGNTMCPTCRRDSRQPAAV